MSFTTTITFTRTHAKQLAAKVTADLYQCHVLYDRPSEDDLDDYQTELIEMLANEYVETYEFGFKKDDKRVLSWRYTVGSDGGLYGDSNVGQHLRQSRCGRRDLLQLHELQRQVVEAHRG